MDSVKASHYHLACTRVFEVTHGLKKGEGLGGGGGGSGSAGNGGESVVHPNKYVDRSRELERWVVYVFISYQACESIADQTLYVARFLMLSKPRRVTVIV